MAAGEGESVSMANGLPQLFSDFSSLDKPVLIAVALSCEAAGADAAFVVDESNKDAMGVANDLKVLLNDSKLVGKVADASVSEFPQDLGSFRKYCKLTRSQLNSPNTSEKVLSTDFSSLSQSLWYLVEGSYSRAKRNVDAVRDMGMRESLASLFARDCPMNDALVGLFSSSGQACFGGEYVKFFQGLHSFVECGRFIVSWEIVTALISLVGSELLAEKTEGNEGSGECGKVDKKKKKNKVVLGKGTLVLVQYLKDNLLNGVPALQPSVLVEKCVEFFMSLLNPKNSGFGMLMEKVKEIVESNEKRRRPKIAKGTLDNANEKMAVREKAFSTIQGVFKKHGATALDTPVFELRETLTGKYGEESKLIYDLADQGGELCSLRYDLTVPFARYVAMNGLTSFKRYQIAKVYRRENTSKGRLREFYQCDFDIAGQYETMGPDFEAIKVITELLDDLNIGEYEVKLNHRKILDAILDICGVPAEKFKAICSSIDKLDKLSFEQVKKEMVEEKGLTGDVADLIGTYVKIRGPPMEVLSMLKLQGSKFLEKKQSLSALNELEILFKALKAAKCINKIVFDLSLARGLDYYTGVIFEAVIIKEGATQVGSIGGGGRYDNLIGMFGDKQVPAVGVSLGIERVFMIMEQIQKDQNQVTRSTETEVLVSIIGNDIENDLPLAAEISSDLWAAGIKTEFMVNKRMDKHTNRVKASKIPWMVIVGDHERNEGVVTLKDMTKKTPNEEKLPLDVNYVNEILSRIKGISP